MHLQVASAPGEGDWVLADAARGCGGPVWRGSWHGGGRGASARGAWTRGAGRGRETLACRVDEREENVHPVRPGHEATNLELEAADPRRRKAAIDNVLLE